MKKLIYLLLFATANAYSQDPYLQLLEKERRQAELKTDNSTGFPKIINDTLYLTETLTIQKGDTVRLGKGSNADGTFRFISISSGSLFRFQGNAPNVANNVNALQPDFANMRMIVHTVRKVGNSIIGFKYLVITRIGDMARYQIDVFAASDVGEVVIPGLGKKAAASTDKLGDLKKLKELLDIGAITQQEFDAEKKKILGN